MIFLYKYHTRKNMKILLLGGTGAMGTHLSKILSDRGDKVTVTSRRNNETKNLVTYRKGNAKKLYFLKEILNEKWDSIIDFMVYSENEFSERIDLLLNSTSQYIFLSSSRVYSESQGLITENSKRLLDACEDEEYLLTSEYAISKARQENMLFSSKQKNWTIIRPYITYSEKRLQLGTLEKENWLYRALKGRTIVFSEDIKNHITTLTYGFDVANGIASIINDSKSFGEAYHITNNSSYRWSEIIDIYLDVLEKKLGNRPKIIYQNFNSFLEWNPGKYQIMYDRMYDRKFDNKKVNRFINTKDFIPVEVGLKKCLNEFLLNPTFLSINWKNEALKDKITKERTLLREINGVKETLKYVLFRYFIKTNGVGYKILKKLK